MRSHVDEPRHFIQSVVSQKEKNKYCILMHIYGILKNGVDEPICKAGIETQKSTDEPICRTGIETYMENWLMDTDGEEKGGMN